jgi:hypothetical protein
MPEGVEIVPVGTNSTTSDARIIRNEVFIAGTEPQPAHTSQGILGRLFHPQPQTGSPATAALPPGADTPPPGASKPPQPDAAGGARGVLRKFLAVFKHKNSKPEESQQDENDPDPQK